MNTPQHNSTPGAALWRGQYWALRLRSA